MGAALAPLAAQTERPAKRPPDRPTIDTIIMGRKTYDVSLQMGGGGSDSGIKTYVFSGTPKESGDPNVEIVSTDAAFNRSCGPSICASAIGYSAPRTA